MKTKFMGVALFLSVLLVTGAGCVSLSSNDQATTTGPGGVFTTPDQAETWKQVSLLPTVEGVKSLQAYSVYDFLNDPVDPDTFYWASRGNGIFYTTDGAASWSRAEAPLRTGFIYSMAIHPEDHCVIYATNGRQVYRSTDCVRSWKEVYREAGSDRVRSIVVNPHSPFQIFLLKEKGDVLESTDSGVSWQVVARIKRAQFMSMSADPNRAGVFYIASKSKGLYRSEDSGRTWTILDKGLKKYAGALAYRKLLVYPSKENVLYWISTYGILRSTDAGETWAPFELLTPPGGAKIYAFGVNEKNEKEMYYTATIGIRSTFYKSIDGGQTWIPKKLPSGQIPTAIRVHPTKGEVLFVGFAIPPKK